LNRWRGWFAGALAVVVLVTAGGVVVRKAASDHDTDPIPDEAFLPAPRGVRLVSGDGGSCGSGGDFECGRVSVIGDDGASAAATSEIVRNHLDDRGWDLRPAGAKATGCREGGHYCVTVEPFADRWDHEAGSPDERQWAETFSLQLASLDDLRERGLWISFSDCCGDRWPF
jgi:hypothetical protein